MPARSNYQQLAINIAGSGAQTIFTNPSATRYAYVWELYMTVAAATNVTFLDGAGALTGNINMLAGSAFQRQDLGFEPCFIVSPNANFSVSESVGVQKSGYVHFSN